MSWFDAFKKTKKDPIDEYSIRIFKSATTGVDSIKTLSSDKSLESERYGLTKIEWFSVFNEFQYFFLHLTDRFAFGNMNDDRRNEILTRLENLSIDLSVETVCDRWPSETIEKIKKESMRNFITSMNQYAQYKDFFAEKGRSPKETLFWEFGKQIACLAGRDMDIAYIMCAVEAATNAMKELDINRFIEASK